MTVSHMLCDDNALHVLKLSFTCFTKCIKLNSVDTLLNNCVETPPSAYNVTLPAFAVERRGRAVCKPAVSASD